MALVFTDLHPYLPYITGAAAVITTSILGKIVIRCCIRGRHDEERNSRLAMLLMILLSEKPNRKYVRVAKQIGTDHIVSDELFDDESETE